MAVIRARIKNTPNPTPITFEGHDIKRNFMMHIWPVAANGGWQWNCDHVLKRAKMFNGHRVIAIVTSPECDSADDVKKYMADFTDDFIIMENNPVLREVITFLPMLNRFTQRTTRGEITFCCHAKGVRHGQRPETATSTIFKWADIQYQSALDYWPLVKRQLEQFPMTGNFKRYGEFTTPGNNRWHYSGTYYWFRNEDVFRRDWQHVDQKFFGTESWPGYLFCANETGCLFLDGSEDLYDNLYFNKIVTPEWQRYQKANAAFLQPTDTI